jgi:hypothetical protein
VRYQAVRHCLQRNLQGEEELEDELLQSPFS